MPDINSKLQKCLPFSGANLLMIFLFSLGLIVISPFLELDTQNTKAVLIQQPFLIEEKDDFSSFQKNTLVAQSETYLNQTENSNQKIRVVVTAYSSTIWQTDDTPFITAAGTWVREGIVAANFLPFGTKIKIPEIYGNKTFVVEDRMHPRNYYHVDIWFPTYLEAKTFGSATTYVEVLEN